MPITTAQQLKILYYLGWPLKTEDPSTDLFSQPVIGRISNFTDDALVIIQDIIDKLDTTYTQMYGAQPLIIADGVSDIKINKDKLRDFRKATAFWVHKLSEATNLMVAESIDEGSGMGVVKYG